MDRVVLISGMHRSGTSMVARLLSLGGVYLGPEDELFPPAADNLEGYWENRQFVLLNDELLAQSGGGWDFPPKLDYGWERSSRFSDLRSRAQALIQQFSDHHPWGWKDPRNSLTLPFWKQLIPSIKMVICVRNPLEVADSLFKRNYFSPALAFHLWFEYNQRILLDSEPENRIITHYNAYFDDPYSELRRVFDFLALDVSDRQIRESIETVDIRLRHHQSTFSGPAGGPTPGVLELYQEMCNQTRRAQQLISGEPSPTQATPAETWKDGDHGEGNARRLSVELIRAQNNLAEKEQSVRNLSARLDAKEKELSGIYQSRAWFLVQTVRKIRHKFTG